MLPNVIELAYYSNTLLGHYVLKSVVATGLLAVDTRDEKVSQSDLVQSCLDFCDVLQYEFIFCKPCQQIDSFILDSIDDFIVKHEVFIEEKNERLDNEYHGGRRIPNPALLDDDSEDEPMEMHVKYEVNGSDKTRELLAFLRGVLKPIVEAYAITALCLEKLVGQERLENELLDEIIEEMQRQLQLGSLAYEESVSVDSIKNALKLFQKWDVLACHTEKKIRLYYLKDMHDNIESVRTIYDRVNRFRYAPIVSDD